MYTCGLIRSQTSTVKIVALLLNAEDREDITAAIITAIMRPTIPVGRMFNTSLPQARSMNRKIRKVSPLADQDYLIHQWACHCRPFHSPGSNRL